MSTDPTAREIPVDELAEAECAFQRFIDEGCDCSHFPVDALERVRDEYDRRGAAERARTAELRSVREKLDCVLGANDKHHAELERLRGELERAQAEVIRLRPIEQRAREELNDPYTLPGQARAYRRILGEA